MASGAAESRIEADAALDRMARREGLRVLLPLAPALIAVLTLIVLPMAWLSWLSFLDDAGEATAANYLRLTTSDVYYRTFLVTFQVSLLVTAVCILLGYPLAYLMTELPRKFSSIVLLAVLLPYWTSILVRTYAWLIILQRRGILNEWLIETGVIEAPLRLVHNFTGTVIGMVHIMLPFFVLPVYGAMLRIDRTCMMAAASLGTRPAEAFFRVFLPLSLPGVLAGSFLVFVLSIGFYVTPAILGGGRIIMIAQQLENAVSLHANWGVAAALGVVLLVLSSSVLVLAALVARFMARAGRQ